MYKKSVIIFKHYLVNSILSLLGGIFLISYILTFPPLHPRSVIATTQTLSTSIYMRIYNSFSGTLTYHTGAGIEINNVFYIAQTDQLIWIDITSPGTFRYTLSGDVSSGAHGLVLGGMPVASPFTLPHQEGPLSFFGIFTSAGGSTSGDAYLTPYVNYYLDLTPPTAPTTLTGPSGILHPGDPLYFGRSPVIDTGAGLAGYHIQLSRHNSFNTYIEFTTQQEYLDLAIGSIDSGRWYRRRVGEDLVGNKQYSASHLFKIPPGGPATIQEDICPNGDSSGSPYDGICSITLTPSLVNTPPEHQAPENWSRIDETRKTIAYLTNIAPREQKQPYLFPNYSAPIPYTIYEYPDPISAIEETVYEGDNVIPDAFVRALLNQQQVGYLPSSTTASPHTSSSLDSLGNGPIFATQSTPQRSYLQQWYLNPHPLCSDYFQACLIIPHCPDVYSDCTYWGMESSCNNYINSLQELQNKEPIGPLRCLD